MPTQLTSSRLAFLNLFGGQPLVNQNTAYRASERSGEAGWDCRTAITGEKTEALGVTRNRYRISG